MRLQWVGADVFRSAFQKNEDVAHFGVLKSVVPEQIRAVDKEQRIVEFTISTGTVDRQADTISVSGWDLAAYAQNPVVLFGHDQWSPVVAQSLATWVEANKLKSRAQFVERDIYPFAYMIFQLYAGGYMRATSVGFRPLEFSFAEDRAGGINFIRQELLEYSCVPVPANAEALAEAKSHGVDLVPLKAWSDRWLDESRGKTHGATADDELKIRGTVERMRALADPDGRSLMLCLGNLKFPGCACHTDTKVVPSGSPESVTTTAAPPAKAADPVVDALPAGVTRFERFGCSDASHVHATAVEAAACVTRAAGLGTVRSSIDALLAASDLPAADRDRLTRASAALQLDPAPAATDTPIADAKTAPIDDVLGDLADFDTRADDDVLDLVDDDVEDDAIELDAADIAALSESLREAVREQRMLLTGRVDD